VLVKMKILTSSQAEGSRRRPCLRD
jgi:hypothetical protein